MNRIAILSVLVAMFAAYGSWVVAADGDGNQANPLLRLPTKPDDPVLKELVDRVNSVAAAIRRNDGKEILRHPQLAPPEGSGAPTVEVKFTYKGGQLTQVSAATPLMSGFQLSFGSSGYISMYSEGNAKSMTGVVIWADKAGRLTAMQTGKDGMLLGRQLKWDESGALVKDEDFKEPRKIELRP